MVNLTRIYTRTGDGGETRLADLSLARKTDPRVDAYGHVDEANCVLGIVRSFSIPNDVAAVLAHCQNELFDVGADLATPYDPEPKWAPLRIETPSIDRLEAWCDEFGAELPPLKSFILPAGSPATTHLNLARTIVRRAERTAWVAVETFGAAPEVGGVCLPAVKYLNRLSDLLFVLGRFVQDGPEVLWVPGTDRQPPDAKAQRNRDRIATKPDQD